MSSSRLWILYLDHLQLLWSLVSSIKYRWFGPWSSRLALGHVKDLFHADAWKYHDEILRKCVFYAFFSLGLFNLRVSADGSVMMVKGLLGVRRHIRRHDNSSSINLKGTSIDHFRPPSPPSHSRQRSIYIWRIRVLHLVCNENTSPTWCQSTWLNSCKIE